MHRLLRTSVVLAAALAASATPAPPRLTVAYPHRDEVVRHDVVPVWLLFDDPAVLARALISLNEREISAEFAPGSPTKGMYHALAHVAPRPGPNRLVVELDETVQRVDFEYEPLPLKVGVRVVEDGRPVPARISFHGLGETPDPSLAPAIWSKIARGQNKREHERNFVYTRNGTVELHLPDGRYQVLASRGPAYSIARGTVSADAPSAELSLTRVMDTAGWISADFHVHAMPSKDGNIPLWDRVVSYLAHDVDVIVASDHHSVTDYRRDVPPSRDWPETFEAIPGVETGLDSPPEDPLDVGGHWNFWPIERPADATPLTSVRPAGVRNASELYATMRSHNRERREARFGPEPVIVQMNHPRGIQFLLEGHASMAHGFLRRVHYDRDVSLAAKGNGGLLERPAADLPRPIDVDSIELLNRLSYKFYLDVRDDWLAWLRQGFVRTAVANSDSHSFVITEAGFPRNWVRYAGPLPVAAGALARAVRQRQVVGSTGPLIELQPWSRDGSALTGPLDLLTAEIQAPPWMPVREVRVHVGLEPVRRIALPRRDVDPYSRTVQRFRVEVPVAIDEDTFILVEAGDPVERLLDSAPHDGPLGKAFPLVRVVAFTNALLVDADGDGKVSTPRSRSAPPHAPGEPRD